MWQSVRRGEENNIFPYQEEADVMFNSSLIYELAVLKEYVEPLLFGIEHDCPEYPEVKRLLKFLDYFVGIGKSAGQFAVKGIRRWRMLPVVKIQNIPMYMPL